MCIKRLHQIFNSDLDELRDLALKMDGLNRDSIYIELLISYLTFEYKNVEKLLNKIHANTNLQDHEILYYMAKFRFSVMNKSVKERDITELLTTVNLYPHWSGEALNIIAYNYMSEGKFKLALKYFKEAHNWFDIKKIHRRKLLAYHNYIICEANLNIKQTTIPDLMFLLKETSKYNYADIEALILMNLSREYQNYNAHNLALKYCYQAEELSMNCIGSLRYWSIQSLKADLLIDLSRIHEAKLCIELLSASGHKENKEAVKVLKQKISLQQEDIDLDCLQATWKERFNGDLHRVNTPALGDLEQKLIEYITQAPREKNNIIDHLYGDKIDYTSLENRFKRLLSRTRKKVPGLILFINKKYCISDHVFAKRIC